MPKIRVSLMHRGPRPERTWRMPGEVVEVDETEARNRVHDGFAKRVADDTEVGRPEGAQFEVPQPFTPPQPPADVEPEPAPEPAETPVFARDEPAEGQDKAPAENEPEKPAQAAEDAPAAEAKTGKRK